LFLRLHKWAARQDENYLTEALALVLELLLEREPGVGVRLVEALTGGFLTVPPAEASTIDLRTQVETEGGRPDLELRSPNALVLIEVKVEAEVRTGQLEGYRLLLQQSGVARTSLGLLTRYPVALGIDVEKPDLMIYWYQIAEWIDQECRHATIKDTVSRFLCEQFLGFLEARNMTIGQVTWELSGGVRALRALGDMLCTVATACGCHALPYGSRNYLGVHLENRSYWLGIYYDRPEVLWFETGTRQVDKEAAARLGIEGVHERESGPGYGWGRQLTLDSEDAHFFVRSKARQMHLLQTFLRECLEIVRQIEISAETGAPAADEEPEAPGTPPSEK
jgi:hypothetical protein